MGECARRERRRERGPRSQGGREPRARSRRAERQRARPGRGWDDAGLGRPGRGGRRDQATRIRLLRRARRAHGLAAGVLWALALAAPVQPARALEDIVVGERAIASGQPGGAADASAASADPSNRAVATGGRGGEPAPPRPGGRGGDATAHAATDTSGPATAEAIARGGQGGSEIPLGGPVAEGGAGGDALASATARNGTADPVNVTASAFGGFGGDAEEIFSPGVGGDGGAARLGVVEGISTGGGDVTVTGLAVSGSGGIGATPGRTANVVLENAVRGETSGALALRQTALTGSQGSIDEGAIASSTPGAAISHLSHTGSSESLRMDSRASARPNRILSIRASHGVGVRAGGDARASATGSNTGGSATVNAAAVGGNARAGLAASERAEGGDARVGAEGVVVGDGRRLVVGSPSELADETEFPEGPPFSPLPGLGAVIPQFGAFAGGVTPERAGVAFADGGDATSESFGMAHGDSEVIVRDQARGGDLFGLGRRSPFRAVGDGGSASSFALAQNAGSSRVEADARALGGGAGFGLSPDGVAGAGGAASAEATALGRGEAVARAVALGGTARSSQGRGPEAGTGLARAFARGSTGSATAEAGFEAFRPVAATEGRVALRTRAVAAVVSSARSEARVGAGHPLSGDIRLPGVDAAVHGVAAPGDEALEQALAGEPEVAAAFDALGVTAVEALGRFGLADALGREDSILLSAEMEVDLSSLVSPSGVGPPSLAVGFLAPEGLAEDDFGSLSLRLEDLGGEVLREYIFGDLAEAISFLAGRALELPASDLVSDPGLVPFFPPDPFGGSGGDFGRVNFVHGRFGLRVILELDAAPEAAFGLGVAVGRIGAVPEPDAALLLGIGLAIVAGRRRPAE